jgi:hypothetical protein
VANRMVRNLSSALCSKIERTGSKRLGTPGGLPPQGGTHSRFLDPCYAAAVAAQQTEKEEPECWS